MAVGRPRGQGQTSDHGHGTSLSLEALSVGHRLCARRAASLGNTGPADAAAVGRGQGWGAEEGRGGRGRVERGREDAPRSRKDQPLADV